MVADPGGQVYFPESKKTEQLKIYRSVLSFRAGESYHGKRGVLLPFVDYVKEYPDSSIPGFVEGY